MSQTLRQYTMEELNEAMLEWGDASSKHKEAESQVTKYKRLLETAEKDEAAAADKLATATKKVRLVVKEAV